MPSTATSPTLATGLLRSGHTQGIQIAVRLILGATFFWCFRRAVTYASLLLSIGYATYDDEGYVLVSVREFLAGRPLYDDVFSQYGPTYYAYKHLLSLVQGIPTHDLTRLTTLGTWMCAAMLLGLAALWLTRSGLAAIAVFCASSVALVPVVNEPGHPQELLVALTALSVAVAACPIKASSRLTLLASITALAGLTKINVGMFIGLATLTAALPLVQATTRTLFALALGTVPALLMFANLNTWAWPYALGSGAGITTAVAMRPATRVEISTFWSRASLLTALVAPAALICIYVMARHTTVAALLDGIVFRPARTANLWLIPLPVPVSAVVVSLAAAGVAMYAMHWGSQVRQHSERILPFLKVGVGLYVILAGAGKPGEIIGGSALIVLALLLWRSPGEHEPFGRAFLALSAALHTCTAYPVAGSQAAWSSFLLIVAAYVCLWDGLAGLRSTVTDVPPLNRVIATGLFCVGAAIYYGSLTPLADLEAKYRNGVPLPFKGATSIRLVHEDVAAYNWVTQNLKGHCSAFVTMPGYGSFYPWSGIRPPTGYNNGAWMILLNDAEQRKTVERMRETPRPCAVYHPEGHMWTAQSMEGRPLVDYIMALSTVATHAGFELRMPPKQAETWEINYLQSGNHSFNGTEVSPVPAEAVTAPTLRLWFKGAGRGGTIVGAQSQTTRETPASWCPMIYLGTDGRLRAGLWNGGPKPVTTANRVDDHEWHHVVLVKRPDSQRLYVDGNFVGETMGAAAADWAAFMQLGTGFTAQWPSGNGSWFPFRGELRDVAVVSRPWDLDDVSRDYSMSRDRSRNNRLTAR